MTHSPRRTIIAATTVALVTLTGCTSSLPGTQFTPEETTTPTGQANAPTPPT